MFLPATGGRHVGNRGVDKTSALGQERYESGLSTTCQDYSMFRTFVDVVREPHGGRLLANLEIEIVDSITYLEKIKQVVW